VRPSSVTEATDSYFANQDHFGQWLGENCDSQPGNTAMFATSHALFASWQAFAKRVGEESGSQKMFAAAMERRKFKLKRTSACRGFVGVRLKADRAEDSGPGAE
jgi:putative DNA primase/helicase